MATPDFRDAHPSDLIITGRNGQLQLGDAVLNISVTRTTDGASTLDITLLDPDRKILNSDVIKGKGDCNLFATCEFGGIHWRLVRVAVRGPRRLFLQFEERAVWELRQFNDPLHVSRANSTRAQFVKRLCIEAKVPYVISDLDKVQPITKTADKLTAAEKNRRRHPGIPGHASIRVAGGAANSEQLHNMELALDVARSHKAGDLATLALVEACIVEPGTSVSTGFFTNPSKAVDHTSTGILQLLSTTAHGLGISATDVGAVCAAFLTKGFYGQGGAISLAKKHADWSAGQIAQAVQGSQYPARYDIYRDDAQKIIDAYSGGDLGTFTGNESDPGSYAKTYYFRRGQDGKREDSWTAIRRLAKEVNWYAFCEDGTIYFLSPEYMRRSKPRMLVAVNAPGIESAPTFEYDTSPKVENTISVQARVGGWDAPPGSVVEVDGHGPLDGRDWIAASITRDSLASNLCSVGVNRILNHRDEPAHELGQHSATDTGSVVGDGVVGDTTRAKVISAATHSADLSAGDAKYYRYSQSGKWKDDLFERDAAGERSDCSSWVIQVYAKALGGYNKLPASMRHQGFTGTLAAAGHKTSKPQPGDICLYGVGPNYHHVELYVGDGKTIGHGSPPVDYATPRGISGFAGYWTFDFLDSGLADLPAFQP